MIVIYSNYNPAPVANKYYSPPSGYPFSLQFVEDLIARSVLVCCGTRNHLGRQASSNGKMMFQDSPANRTIRLFLDRKNCSV